MPESPGPIYLEETRIKARAKARAFHSSWGALPPKPPQSSILKFSLGYGSLRRARPSLECFLKCIQNRRQNESKIFQKSFKNHPKSMQKNPPKITPWENLEAAWRRLWAYWVIGTFFGRLGAILDPSQERLRASWGRLGRALGPTWCPLASQNGAKMAKKSTPKSIIFVHASWDHFFTDVLWIFEGKMEPSWDQNEIRNRSYVKTA